MAEDAIRAEDDMPGVSRDLARRFAFVIEGAEIRARMDEIAAKSRRHVRLPGFRPGKVPAQVARSHFAKEYREQAESELVQKAVRAVMRDPAAGEAIDLPRILMSPRTESEADDGDPDDVEGAIEFEVFPEIPVPDWATLQVEAPRIKLDDGDIEDTLRNYCRDNPAYGDPDSERPVQLGDRITLEYVSPGKSDDDDNKQFSVIMSEEPLSAKFMGKKTGTTVAVDLPGPERPETERDGAPSPEPVVLCIRSVQPMESDEPCEEVAKANGFGSLVALRTHVERSMTRKTWRIERALLRYRVHEALEERLSFDVPPDMFELGLHLEGVGKDGKPNPTIDRQRALRGIRQTVWNMWLAKKLGIEAKLDDLVRAAWGWGASDSASPEFRAGVAEIMQDNNPSAQELAAKITGEADAELLLDAVMDRASVVEHEIILADAVEEMRGLEERWRAGG